MAIRRVRTFRGKVVHAAWPVKRQGQPTGLMSVVFAARQGQRRQTVIVSEEEYRAGRKLEVVATSL